MIAPFLTPLRTLLHRQPEHLLNKGTGNVMFQVASILGLARSYGMQPNFRRLRYLAEIYRSKYSASHHNTIFRNFTENFNEGRLTRVIEFENCHKQPDWNILRLITRNPFENYLIDGYLEWPPYFMHIKDELIGRFAPDERSLQLICDIYPQILSRDSVSVHFRNGSPSNYEPSMSYYLKAIDIVRRINPRSHFFLFSEEPLTGYNFDFPFTPVEYVKDYNRNDDYLDIWAMSLCANNIIGYSTFAWWAAFLNLNPVKMVFYPVSSLAFISSDKRLGNGFHHHVLHKSYFCEWIPVNDCI